MKTFFFIFYIFSFTSVFVQFFFIDKIIKRNSFSIHLKLFNNFSYNVQLYKPFRFKFYHRYFDISYNNTLFFFSNHNSQNFFFKFYKSFSISDFFSNKNYYFSTYLPPFRSNFINYSLTYINICCYYTFSNKDFENLTFSEDFSFVFGSFSVIHSSHVSDNPFTFIYKYNFVFSMNDFSIALYITFSEFDTHDIIMPVSFIKLSFSDYAHFINNFSSISTNSTFKLENFKSTLSNLFCSVFSTILIPSRDHISFGTRTKSYLFIKNMIYSNIDTRFFKVQDTPLEYYTLKSIPKDFDFHPKFSRIRAFSFYKPF